MVVGGKDMRNGMTEDERDKFIKGMAKMAQNNSMKLIEGMAEQVGNELRGQLDRQKEAVRMQQEQLQAQQGQIQQLVDLVRTLSRGAPPLLAAMMKGAEGLRRSRARESNVGRAERRSEGAEVSRAELRA